MKQHRVESVKDKAERDAIFSRLLQPQRHSSFRAAAVMLSDAEGAGCDMRRHLRERFVFHTERQPPKKLPPMMSSVISREEQQQLHTSLQAVFDAYRPRWLALFQLEKDRRADIAREHTDGLEALMKQLSRTMDLEAMVRPEVAVALGIAVLVQMPNYLEEEERAFQAAKSVLLLEEESMRNSLSTALVQDAAALRRSCIRRLRKLQADYDAQIAAAALEAAQQQERRQKLRESQIEQAIAQTFDDERDKRYVEHELAEFAERHTLEFRIRSILATHIRTRDHEHFQAMMSNHFAIGALEKNGRDAVESEEREAFVSLKESAQEVERQYSLFLIRTKMARLLANEEMLRPQRECMLLRVASNKLFEAKVTLWLNLYAAELMHRWTEDATQGPTSANATTFLAFCEGEERKAIERQHETFVSDAERCCLDAAGCPHAAALWLDQTMTRYCDTPSADLGMDSSTNRSLVPSRQLSSRRPLWSAGGGGGVGGRSSRVPTSEGGPHNRSSRYSTPAAGGIERPPLPPAVKMDL